MTNDMDAPHQGAGGGARLSDSLTFHHHVQHVHALGPRPVGEAMLELAWGDRDVVVAVLERYAGLTPALVEAVDARDWIRPAALVREVGR
jgi:hypothetical protein